MVREKRSVKEKRSVREKRSVKDGTTANLLALKGNREKKYTTFPNTMTTKHMTQTPMSCV